jgi:hypothetical protein
LGVAETHKTVLQNIWALPRHTKPFFEPFWQLRELPQPSGNIAAAAKKKFRACGGLSFDF